MDQSPLLLYSQPHNAMSGSSATQQLTVKIRELLAMVDEQTVRSLDRSQHVNRSKYKVENYHTLSSVVDNFVTAIHSTDCIMRNWIMKTVKVHH